MRRLLAAVCALLCFASVLFGANPSYTSFLGTNGIIITSNPPQGFIIIDGRALTNGFVSGVGDQVWTNDVGVIYTIVDPSRIQFLTNRIFGRLIRADGTNTVFGSNALPPNVGAVNSVAIGSDALSRSSGGENVAIGHRALATNSSGLNNVAVGYRAMEFNDISEDNVALGYSALREFTTGHQNTALGAASMVHLTTSYDGTAVGYGAMDKLEGIGNTALGSRAISGGLGGGNYNLVAGNQAMFNSDRLEGNVALGGFALTGIDDLTNVVAIGYQATAISGGLTNAVGIGALTRITADNQMMLGTNITRYVFRNVDYTFPSANGAAGTALTNNGAGILGWGTVAGSGGTVAFSDLIWTNDNGTLKPVAFPTNVLLRVNVPDNGTGTNYYFDSRVYRTNATSKLFAIYNGGSNAVTVGPYGGLFMGRGNPTPFPGVVLYGIYDTALGETNQQEIFTMSQNSAVGYNGAADLIVDTNYGAIILFANKEGGTKFSRFAIQAGAGINPQDFNTFSMQALVDGATYFQVDPNFTLLTPTNYLFSSSVRITNIHTLLSLQNSNFPVLEVDGVGDLRLIKKIPYQWPSAQGAAGTALTNNGSGILGWGAVASGGGLTFADLIWTNNTDTIYPYVHSNRIHFGTSATNGARLNLEWYAPRRSFRVGQLSTGIGSDYWDVTNLGIGSVSFGSNNLAGGYMSAVLSGYGNIIPTNYIYSVIVGGTENLFAESSASGRNIIGGGSKNQMDPGASNCVIVGGFRNRILTDAFMSSMVGGADNISRMRYGSIGGGSGNETRGIGSVVGGGLNNISGESTVDGLTTIGGGSQNSIHEDYGTIGGGFGNFLQSSALYGTIGGGRGNVSDAISGTIAGGSLNNIDGFAQYGVISGGYTNFIGNPGAGGSHFSFIPGGVSNKISGAIMAAAIGSFQTNTLDKTILLGTTNNNRVMVSTTNLNLLEDMTILMTNGAGAGKVLTSDANGKGTWGTASAGSGTFTNIFSPTLSNATIKPLVVGLGTAAGATNTTGEIRGIEAGANITITPNGSNYVISSTANFVSLSTTNATSKPLTNSYASGVLTMFGIEQGSGQAITVNASNIVVGIDWAQVASTTNVVGVSNWVNSVSNYVTAATNSASVTNWITQRQPANAVLSNLVGTVAKNVTNVVSLSTTNATSKPLTNSYTSGVLTIFGIEQGSGQAITMNASNILVAIDWAQTASTTNVVGVSNWVNSVSNYVTAATNSASVTNWITQRQPASQTLTNLSGTGAITNVFSASLSNATMKPVVFPSANNFATNYTGRFFGLEQGANVTLTPNGSNIVIASSGSGGSSLTTNANQFGASVELTIKDAPLLTNAIHYGAGFLGSFTNVWTAPQFLGTNVVFDGTNSSWFQFNPATGPQTNYVFTNIQAGQTIVVKTYVTNGTTVRLWANTTEIPASWYIGNNGSAANINSNAPSVVYVSRDSLVPATNVLIWTRDFDVTAGYGLIYATNFVAGIVTQQLQQIFQPGNATLTNLAGTGAVTNLFSPTLSNGTIKPLVVGVGTAAGATNVTGEIRGLEAGANITITPNGSNYVIASTGGGGVALSDLVWTNRVGELLPNAYPTNTILSPTNAGFRTNFYFGSTETRAGGTNKVFRVYNGTNNALTVGDAGIFIGSANGTPINGQAINAIYDTSLGDAPSKAISLTSQNSAVGFNSSAVTSVSTNFANTVLTADRDGTGFINFTQVIGQDATWLNFDMYVLAQDAGGTIIRPFQFDPDFSLSPTSYLFNSTMRITNTHTLMSLQNSNTPMFEVNGIGDLKLLKRIPYSWPNAQGAAQTVLTNDGSGNLGWGAVSASGGSVTFADIVWTNKSGTLYPIAYPTNIIFNPTNTVSAAELARATNFLFQTSTRRIGGTNVLFAVFNGGASALVVGDQGIMIGSTNYIPVPQAAIDIAYDTAFGVDSPEKSVLLTTYNSVVGYSGNAEMHVSTNYGDFNVTANKEGNGFVEYFFRAGGAGTAVDYKNFDAYVLVQDEGATIITPYQIDPDFSLSPTGYIFGSTMRITNTHTLMSLQNSNTPMFEVNGIGDLKLLKRVAYSWPSAQGAAQTVLTNDGSGNLGWGAVAASGGGLATNANQFGANTTLSIKEGVLLTNIMLYPSNLTSPASIATASVGSMTNLIEWRQTNGALALLISSNGLYNISVPLLHSNAVAFRTNNIDFKLAQWQTFSNALKTNLVLQLTNCNDGVTHTLNAFGSGRLGNGTTNAWQLLCTVASGNTIYWPPGSTNGNFDVLVNSNQVVTFTFQQVFNTNIFASYLVREGIGAN